MRFLLARTELEELQSNGVLSKLVVSFSRDGATEQGKPRYVQDNLACHGAEVATLLCQGGATVFVCGDAKHMAKDVNDAIVSVIQKHRGNTYSTHLLASVTKYPMSIVKRGQSSHSARSKSLTYGCRCFFYICLWFCTLFPDMLSCTFLRIIGLCKG